MKHFFICGFLLTVLISCGLDKTQQIQISGNSELIMQLDYPIKKLRQQLDLVGNKLIIAESGKADYRIELLMSPQESDEPNDGYSLTKEENIYYLRSECTRGLLYGIQEITNQLQNGKSIGTLSEKTIISQYPFRAIKFNLPWYSYRSGENLSVHNETCRDLKFWESFLDMMLENKFNTLTLWNLHPYIFMVQSEKFPESSPFNQTEMAEWKSFWKELFKMAKDRGIDSYIINWNIFISEEFSSAYNIAEYSKSSGFWGDGETNSLIEEYTREMVTLTIDEYENLTGIGITLGERMGGMTSEERKDWADRTLIAGLKAAKRKARLIYRAPLSAGKTSHGTTSVTTEKMTRDAIENLGLDDNVWVEFKFNWSHAHSSPKVSIVHGGMLTETYWEPVSDKYKGVWTMRNEDFHVMRWAQPDFIREFIKYNSQDYIGGCIIGSETYIPAKDYITKEEHRSWNYAFERQWLFYKIWGNLLFDSNTPDSYFEAALAEKFKLNEGTQLLKAWKLSSANANRFASFFRGTWDATIYTEGFTTIGGRFISVNDFIHHPVLDSSYVNISDYVQKKYDPTKQISPIELATLAETESYAALEIVKSMRIHGATDDLEIELTDIEFWSQYGLYFAKKIRAGVALEEFRRGSNPTGQSEAIALLEDGLDIWKKMTQLAEKFNVASIPYQFDADFSWRKHIGSVAHDIQIASDNIISEDRIDLR